MASVQRFLGNAAAIDDFLRSELRSSGVVRHAVRLLRREGLADTEAWLRDTVTSGRRRASRRVSHSSNAIRRTPPCALNSGFTRMGRDRI